MGTAAIVLDCDGVLPVSDMPKVAVFREARGESGVHPDDVARFLRDQASNFGTSRHRLFEIFLGLEDLRI